MELPKFKCSPNAFNRDLFEEEEGICSACHEKRNLKYTGSFYSIEDPEYICLWCIANEKASEKYDGEFNDYFGIEFVSADPDDMEPTIPKELLLEMINRTPGYRSWQQEAWLYTVMNVVRSSVMQVPKPLNLLYMNYTMISKNNGYAPEFIKSHLSKDGNLVGYLFQCVNCGQHRLHIDCD